MKEMALIEITDDKNSIHCRDQKWTGVLTALDIYYCNGKLYCDPEEWFESLSDEDKQEALYYMDIWMQNVNKDNYI